MRRRPHFLRIRAIPLVSDQSAEFVLHRELPPSRCVSAHPCRRLSRLALICLAAAAALGLVAGASAETWRGLTIAPEHRCSDYDKKRDYPYPQSVERDIVRELGAVYGPYTGTVFRIRLTETDIEHVVAASEAHDSGLVRGGRGDQGPILPRPSQPDPGLAAK